MHPPIYICLALLVLPPLYWLADKRVPRREVRKVEEEKGLRVWSVKEGRP